MDFKGIGFKKVIQITLINENKIATVPEEQSLFLFEFL